MSKASKYLSVSTIHCPHPEFEDECTDFVLGNSAEHTFVYVPERNCISDNTPLWLYYIFLLAIQHGCYIIHFDPMGDEHDELKKFDW
jgi:hypothetical protein